MQRNHAQKHTSGLMRAIVKASFGYSSEIFGSPQESPKIFGNIHILQYAKYI